MYLYVPYVTPDRDVKSGDTSTERFEIEEKGVNWRKCTWIGGQLVKVDLQDYNEI